jgi:acetoin utilization protein AcuB
MSSPAVTVAPGIPFQDALKLMQDRQLRRLPVVDKKGKLVGIVSERDLLHISPSPATSLSIWELPYLLSKIRIGKIMTKKVITTTLDMPIEDAAYLMADNKIGGLPVVDEHNYVVGMITETDIFKAFVEMLAGGRSGLRLTLQVPDKRDVLLELSSAVSQLGGDIVSVGSFKGNGSGGRELVVKVRDARKSQLTEAIEALGDHVIDARNV